MRQLYLRTRSLKRLFSFSKEDHNNNVHENENKKEPIPLILPQTDQSQKPTWKCFSFEEIFTATKGFNIDNLVGRGGYAEVYRGELKNGQIIAVKRLTKDSSDERKEKEFLTELGTIVHVNHQNISSFLGCCIDNGLHLIFEFSLHGSVASLLHDENSPLMSWKVRYKIAVGTARGLNYLHKGCQRRIIHRDIKTSNVLLTADYEPKISDFGLAKWLPSQWTHHSIVPIEGTFGCLAPEYFMHGIVDEKTDVFAYGIFLLEIISGRKPVDGSHQSLLNWAKPLLSEGEVEKLIDPRLGCDYDIIQLNRLAFTALLCTRASPSWRPTMTQVLEIMVDGEMIKENWTMPEEEEDDEFCGFEDLECEFDSPFSTSPLDSISTSSS